MIDIFETLGWLNAIDHSTHINGEARQLIQEARKFSPTDDCIQAMLARLRSMAHSCGNPLEKAELLLHCASIAHVRGWSPSAACDAEKADESYAGDPHRNAVTLWLLGIVQWEMLQNHDAYRNWAHAKEIFRQLEISFQRFQNGDTWYKVPLWRMRVSCATRPEEIWTWLNYFERSSLAPSTQRIVEGVQEKIRAQGYSNIYALMQDLQEALRRCEGVHERAEINLEFGLAAYQMGNTYFAIDLLNDAVRWFYPGIGSYHKEAVACCMLGAMECLHNPGNSQVVGHWMHCAEEFEKLRVRAERDHLEEKEQWYAHHRDLLRAVLLEQHKQNPSIKNGSGFSQQGSFTPYCKKINTYHDLLMEVGWDRAMADRLIEFERKKAPAADRTELINRVLERLRRDSI